MTISPTQSQHKRGQRREASQPLSQTQSKSPPKSPSMIQSQHIPRSRRQRYQRGRGRHNSPLRSLLCSTLILLMAWLLPKSQASIVISLPPEEEECLVIVLNPDKPCNIEGTFELLDDGLTPDPVVVNLGDTETGRMLYRSPRRVRNGKFSITPEPHQRRISICVQNGSRFGDRRSSSAYAPASDHLQRTIGLHWSVTPRKIHKEILDTNDKLLMRAESLNSRLDGLLNHQEYMRVREGKHRDLVESTFDQLLVWVCAEVILLIVIAIGQVLYFRRFLERRHYM